MRYLDLEGSRGATLDELNGFGRREPLAALAFAVFLISLTGIPPTVGFVAKFPNDPAGTDPVGSGQVASLARPGGNITGVLTGAVALSGKRVELLKEAVPRLARFAVLYNANQPGRLSGLARATQDAARTLALETQHGRITEGRRFRR